MAVIVRLWLRAMGTPFHSSLPEAAEFDFKISFPTGVKLGLKLACHDLSASVISWSLGSKVFARLA